MLVLLLAAGVPGMVSAADETATLRRIPAAQARQHLNQEAVVTGKIAEVNHTERIVRLNFDKPFPNQTFTAVIFGKQTNGFPLIAELKDKIVEVSGKITEYRNRPEIIITSTNQLRVPSQLGKESADGKR